MGSLIRIEKVCYFFSKPLNGEKNKTMTSKKKPEWYPVPAPDGSYRSVLKLGKPREVKHPSDGWRAMVTEELGLDDDHFFKGLRCEGNEQVTVHQEIGLSRDQISMIESIVGAENVNADDYNRVKYSYGKFVDEAIELRNQHVAPVCDIVVHPRDKEDVQAIVRYCDDQRIPIIPYGGGSTATLGLSPEKGGVVLVMTTHMNKIIAVNEKSQTAVVQAGLMASDYEEALNHARERYGTAHNYTCGHFPQSFPLTAVGGWVPSLGAGQASTYYGDAYDIVFSQQYVTPAGSFKTHDYPATATGPKVNDIMKGCEGAFGILVEATFKIFRYMPENRRYFAFMFPTWADAVRAGQEIMQGEFGRPAVFRISDGEETETGLKMYGSRYNMVNRFLELRGLKQMQRSLVIGTAEGEAHFAKHVTRMVKKISRKNGAKYLTGVPAKLWEKDRYDHPFMREDMMDFDIVFDTLETPVTWDNIHTVYQSIREFVKSRPNTICMIHASHFYPQGTNLYCIFGTKYTTLEDLQALRADIVDTMVASGGSPSHHHGVGKLLAPWIETHLGSEQMDVLRALKHHFDPNNVMNPGSLLGLGIPEDQ